MPTTPPTQCAAYRCKAASRAGSIYCEQHAPPPRVNHAKRETDAEYKTAAWASIRKRELTRQPLCQACALDGRVALAEHVDHIVPWRHLGAWAFTLGPFQSVCGPCHSRKTALEGRGVFRHYAEGGIVDYGPGNLPPELAERPTPRRF